MLNKINKSERGFTLIELLIVIVIIAILAGVVIAVLNPAQQQRRANESVMRANTDKICLAMHACAASRQNAVANCQSFADYGVNSPAGTPTGSTYGVTLEDTSGTIDPAGPIVRVSGTLGACSVSCIYNTTDGSASQVEVDTGADCLID